MIELRPHSGAVRAIDGMKCAFEAKSLQKLLAMLCGSELKCGLRLVARSNDRSLS
jgi:hypothetical protein